MNFYLQKYGYQPPSIQSHPNEGLGLIVVIPCYNEPDLITSLESIDACHHPGCEVEVIIVLNQSEVEEELVTLQNQQTQNDFENWNVGRKYTYHLIVERGLPKKHAGVGLARKIGMDEAVARFHQLNTDGVIVCFDADAKCEPNYLQEIKTHFEIHPQTPACSIHFEHPISGNDYPQQVYDAIIDYELHLRYYNLALKYCELPYSFHTVGSSMAVRSSAYQKQGGMNKRKAGEDFYFLHKMIALGGFTELKSTCVIPSPRISDRVPFGTGKAVGEYVEQNAQAYLTYAPESFVELKKFTQKMEEFYKGNVDLTDLHPRFQEFLKANNFDQKLTEIKSNTTDLISFSKRFFVWWDAFKVLKLVHFLRDHAFQNIPVKEAVVNFFGDQMQLSTALKTSDILLSLRTFEKK